MTKIKKRQDVSEDLKYDLSHIFENDEIALIFANELLEEAKNFSKLEEGFLETKDSFYETLKKYDFIVSRASKLSAYSHLKLSVDNTCNKSLEFYLKCNSILQQITNALSFLSTKISKIDEEKLKSFFAKKPELSVFKTFIENIVKFKKYSLSDDLEKLLAELSTFLHSPYHIYESCKTGNLVFDDFLDENLNPMQNSFALFEEDYEFSKDRTIRKKSFESFYKTLKQNSVGFSAIYQTEVLKQKTLAEIKGYDGTREMLLFNQNNTIKAYENQLTSLFKIIAPQMRRYIEIKKKILGLDEFHYYDLKAPINPNFTPTMKKNEIEKLIISSISFLGDEYKGIIQKTFSENRIDFAENIGKRSGAFCYPVYDNDSYVFLTLSDNMRSAFLLAHELGHAGHFSLSMRNQLASNTRTSLFLIEAPSTLNELFLFKSLFEKAEDKDSKVWAISQVLGTFHHNMVTHFTEALFQDRVYKALDKNEAITNEFLSNTKLDVLREFWGDSLIVDDYAKFTWMRQPHYYMGLYPYTYSAGLSIACDIYQKINSEPKKYTEKYIRFLKAGGSLHTKDLLNIVDLDMEKPEIFENVGKFVSELLTELENLY